MSIGKFTISGGLLQVAKSQVFKIDPTNPDDFSRDSVFGTPVYSNIEIEPYNYETLDGETVEVKNGIIIDTVLITVSQSKNIVKTPIQGRNGTVKEYVSDGDFQIDISGKIVADSNNYPETEVNELVRILKSPIPIPIISEFLQWFDIHEIVVENYNVPQIMGVRNEQIFSIQCVSDTPVELENLDF
jgi:hypothetical protein